MNEELLIRFLTNQCSSKELETINDWITSDPANAQWLFDIEHVWGLKDQLRFSDKKEIEAAYSRFLTHIKDKKEPFFKKENLTIAFSWFRRVAAAIIIAFLGLNLYLSNDEEDIEMNVIEVPNGQRAAVTLSDGTKVWLNSQSKLTYPAKFRTKKRSVKLEGEGFFEVSHNAESPFFVESNLIHVQVLGTKFNLKSYPDEPSLVTLTEGKVEVTSNNKRSQITLRPNEQVTYSIKTGMQLTQRVNSNNVKLWTIGEIAYSNNTLQDIANDLERQFDVRIFIVDKALASEIFTCHFKKTTPINEVLRLLKETRKIDFQIKEQGIEIYKPLNKEAYDK